ncbi:MAG: 2-oxoacid:acceptor oxidoreductase subunit alpha [Methanospirillum sp.]|nr:2-oxoacid:acceptor oxidoreductase subunit alpha [Methanospirillum sp.]
MTECSVLIGGKAGDGISQAGQLIGSVFASLGYHVYQYTDYPSLIRGGHNYCIVRAAERPVTAYRSGIDLIIAFDQQTVDIHSRRLTDRGTILYDSDRVKATGIPLSLAGIINPLEGVQIMGNTAMTGALFRVLGIPWERIEPVLRRKIRAQPEKNIQIGNAAWNQVSSQMEVQDLGGSGRPFFSGNEWIGLGLLAGGIDAYIAYPMTPASGLLHFLAGVAEETGITVYHPESEIAVILMAQGFVYAGKKTAVGTSGGGFCLMTEALSLAGQAEIPVVIVVSQRTGPSTGLPTYTAQSDLLFIRHAGQGEFPRWIAAPATPEEAYRLGARAVDIAWKYQVPAFILSDKSFSEGIFTGDPDMQDPVAHPLSAPSFPYQRYADTPDGISPILSPPYTGEVIKVNSYTHDYQGITTEDPDMTVVMADKRKRKAQALLNYIDRDESIITGGNPDGKTCIVCWGSVRGQVTEAAEGSEVRIVSPLILEPFPGDAFRKAMRGVERIVVVEESVSGQIVTILREQGFIPDEVLLRYDGRPSAVEELSARLGRVL